MIKNIQRTEYSYEGTITFKLFDKDIHIIIENGDVAYAEKCVVALNDLSESVIELLCKFSELYCRDFCEYVGNTCPDISKSREIMKYIQPIALNVAEPQDNDIVIDLELNCDWEVEHGMEWIIKGNEILYVGSYDGVSAYEEKNFYENFYGNYVFGNTCC